MSTVKFVKLDFHFRMVHTIKRTTKIFENAIFDIPKENKIMFFLSVLRYYVFLNHSCWIIQIDKWWIPFVINKETYDNVSDNYYLPELSLVL